MISTAVMVGEINATDCASSCGKPRALLRSAGPVDASAERGGPVATAPGSVVVFILEVTFQIVCCRHDPPAEGDTTPPSVAMESTMAEPFETITGPRSNFWKPD